MSVPLKTRILLADDHAVVREGLRMVLDAQPDLVVVAEAGDGVEAVQRVLADDIDLAVLDVSMPRMTGLQAAREISRQRPDVKLLMLSMHPAAVTALLRDHLERASRGEDVPEHPLSPREVDVLKLIAEGHTSDEIAGLLQISSKTVDRHRANILEKLGMRNRVELTRYAIRSGLVQP